MQNDRDRNITEKAPTMQRPITERDEITNNKEIDDDAMIDEVNDATRNQIGAGE
jgi:hypothetical protein